MAEPLLRQFMDESEALQHKSIFRLSSWRALRYFMPLLRPYKWEVGLIGGLDIVSLLVGMALPWFLTALIDDAFAQRDWALGGRIIFWMIVTQLAFMALAVVRQMLASHLEIKLTIDLRMRLYTQLQRLSIGFAESSPVGQRVFRIGIDAPAVAAVLARIWPTVIRFVELGFLLLAATALDPFITAVSLGFLVPWAIAIIWLTSFYREQDRKRLAKAEWRDSGVLQGVSSFALLKVFGRTPWETARHTRRSVVTQRIANRHYLVWWVADMLATRVLNYARTAIATFYYYRQVILGEVTLGAAIPALAYLARLGDPVFRIVDFVNMLRRAMVPAERCMQIMGTRSSVPAPARGEMPAEQRGELRFEDVRFAHLVGPEVLRGVNLTLRAGERLAVVGPSGAGKSTVASLAVRLHDPTSGTVSMDGLDLRRANLPQLLQRVAVVGQETFIFGGTLAENLRYGNEDATPEQMMQALSRVRLDRWAASLPHGLEEDLESGNALSVGQRQRIGIARALLANPVLMILDEPTSALDAETESAVMATIEEVTRGMTVMLVTHRLHTAAQMDRIAVLQAGVVAEEGSFDELLARGGAFAELWRAYRAVAA